MSIPTKHKAAVYDAPGKISSKVVEVDTPTPGPGEVLVKLTHSGVCHSDLAVCTESWKGMPRPTKQGQVGGHEGVGVIVAMGPGTEHSARKVGERVGIKWVSRICGSCPACLAGHEGVCFNQLISGYTTPGTFQQYAIGPADYVTPVPDGVDSAEAAPMLCAGVTVYSALLKSSTKSGEWCVILGSGGGLGHLACQIAAKGMGMRVIGVDAGSKRELSIASGAEVFIDHAAQKVDEEVLKATGGLGAQSVIVCTAANPAYDSAIPLLRFGGTLVCVGIPEGQLQPIASAIPFVMIVKQLTIRGSAVGTRKEAIEVLDMMARGLIKTHIRVDKMENLTEIFESMHRGEMQGRVVLDLTA